MKNKKLIMIIAGAAVLLIAIGVILFIILANKYERFIEIDVPDCVEKVYLFMFLRSFPNIRL